MSTVEVIVARCEGPITDIKQLVNKRTLQLLRTEECLEKLSDQDFIFRVEQCNFDWAKLANELGGVDGWSLRARYVALRQSQVIGLPTRAESAGSATSWATGDGSECSEILGGSAIGLVPSSPLSRLSGRDEALADFQLGEVSGSFTRELGEVLLQDLGGEDQNEFGLGTVGGRRRRRLVGQLQSSIN